MKSIFSPTEDKVLHLLNGRKKKWFIGELTEKIYDNQLSFDRPTLPMNAGNSIAQCVRRINKKCEYHKLPWFINSVGGGRGGKKVWLDK